MNFEIERGQQVRFSKLECNLLQVVHKLDQPTFASAFKIECSHKHHKA